MSRSWPITQCAIARTWESAPKQWAVMAIVEDRSLPFETILRRLCLLFKCGIKTKKHFDWLLWHWSSLGQLNLEPTLPNGLVGCKVPTDLVKISVKDATHMGFCYIPTCRWRHFQIRFVEISSFYFDSNFTELVSMVFRAHMITLLNRSKYR